jgi:ubiquinone biosynthesis UbiH/UbiF/VisC/COQ6 family hydroxylase
MVSNERSGQSASANPVWVRGAGVVGRCLALALARQGLPVVLSAPTRDAARPAATDVRAYALNAASVQLLRALRVWDALPLGAATAVYDMRVHGDGFGAAARAPAVVEFSSWQQGVQALAHIVDVAALERALDAAVGFAPHIERLTADQAEARFAHQPSALMALCEGKASQLRQALGVEFQSKSLGQHAIAARLSASLPHRGVAWQWFGEPDVLALLPMDAVGKAGQSGGYALVWSVPSEKAQELMALEAPAFEAQLQAALRLAAPSAGAALGADPGVGELRLCSERSSWPLFHAQAERWCGPGWALLGDAAHVVHPLAGQGLNLGLADVQALSEVIAQREPWRPLGDEKLLRRYVRQRLAPTWAMGQVTDGLLDLFSHPAPWARELRNQGLALVNATSPIKRWLTRRALGL